MFGIKLTGPNLVKLNQDMQVPTINSVEEALIESLNTKYALWMPGQKKQDLA